LMSGCCVVCCCVTIDQVVTEAKIRRLIMTMQPSFCQGYQGRENWLEEFQIMHIRNNPVGCKTELWSRNQTKSSSGQEINKITITYIPECSMAPYNYTQLS
jgi:hypothetical protein